MSWALKRLEASGAVRRAAATIAVLDELALGPRERIVLVRVGDSQVLLGVAAGSVVSLTPLAAPIAVKSPPERTRVRRSPARIHEAARTRPMSSRIVRAGLITLGLLLPAAAALAQATLPALAIKSAADGAQTYSLTFQVLILMTLLTLLPAILLAMTAFTRIIIVLSILRQALGMATTPSNQVLTGLALFLTFFVMSSTIDQAYCQRHQAVSRRPARGRRGDRAHGGAAQEIHARADARERFAALHQARRQVAVREPRAMCP